MSQPEAEVFEQSVIIENLRCITTHPNFNSIQGLNIPVTSEVDVPEINGSIPRGVFVEAVMVAKVIVGSKLLIFALCLISETWRRDGK
jgi:hypothetical protein